MKKDVQRHLMKILYTGHKHAEVTEWIKCVECGAKFNAWKQEKEKLKQKFPEDFERYQKKWLPSPELLNTLERMRHELKQRGVTPAVKKANELLEKLDGMK